MLGCLGQPVNFVVSGLFVGCRMVAYADSTQDGSIQIVGMIIVSVA